MANAKGGDAAVIKKKNNPRSNEDSDAGWDSIANTVIEEEQ